MFSGKDTENVNAFLRMIRHTFKRGYPDRKTETEFDANLCVEIMCSCLDDAATFMLELPEETQSNISKLEDALRSEYPMIPREEEEDKRERAFDQMLSLQQGEDDIDQYIERARSI